MQTIFQDRFADKRVRGTIFIKLINEQAAAGYFNANSTNAVTTCDLHYSTTHNSNSLSFQMCLLERKSSVFGVINQFHGARDKKISKNAINQHFFN
jgi:hypothetical protein